MAAHEVRPPAHVGAQAPGTGHSPGTGGKAVFGWGLACLANLLLGCLAFVPFWLLTLFAINFPLAALGLTNREPTENDGMLPWLLILTPVIAVVLGLWALANVAIRRRISLAPRPSWLIGSALLIALYATSIILIAVF